MKTIVVCAYVLACILVSLSLSFKRERVSSPLILSFYMAITESLSAAKAVSASVYFNTYKYSYLCVLCVVCQCVCGFVRLSVTGIFGFV